METEGYLIVLKPELVLRDYEAAPWIKERMEKYPEAWPALRRAFSQFDPKAYKGISREPLEAYLSLDPKKIEQYKKEGIDMDTNREACMRMYELLRYKFEPTHLMDVDYELFPEIREAREVYFLLECPSDYEIIRVRRAAFAKMSDTLGFDIGNWDGHFSLIADTIVIPQWHPPIPEDYREVGFQLAGLNENLLFDTPHEAANFRDYYMSKQWAEREMEPGDFCIIQVDQVRLGDA